MSQVMEKFYDLTLALLCTARRDGNTFENMNPAWERTLGWSREELCSKSFIEFVHPDDVGATYEIISRLDEGTPAVHFENRYRHKDGHWVWLSWVSVLDQGIHYAAAVDITPYKEAEASLARKNAELAEFNRLAIGREERMIELKREVNSLCAALGQPARYDLSFADS